MNEIIFFLFYNLTHQYVFLDAKIIFFAVYAIFLLILFAGLFLIFHRKSLHEFSLVSLSLGLAWGFSEILKILFHTERPFDVLHGVEPLFLASGYAFPSTHTAIAAGIAFAFLFINKKVGYLLLFLTLLIGIARIAAGVHFPVDILGGVIIGAIIACCTYFFFKRI